MQKIKSQKGITLVALVITIIVVVILAGISITLGTSSMQESKDDNSKTALSIIQQAVITQYTKADTLGYTKQNANGNPSVNKPEIFVGTPKKPSEVVSLDSNISWVISLDTDAVYFEDFYYELNVEDQEKLGLENCEDTFIVNYKTGEVYNKVEKETSNHEALYIRSLNTISESPITTDNSFSE